MAANISPIPQPPAVPFLGNAMLIEQDVPLRSFQLLAQQYGEIYQLVMPGGRVVIHCCSYALVKQLSDDKRFKKPVTGSLNELRRLVGDGLFTAKLEEPNWAIAHRVLMPTFSATNVRGMFDDMKDICSQMILKWERFGSDHVFEPTEDYTRLTLDTIALCAMSLRFNSFYTPTMPPFVQAMFDVLLESGKRALRPALVSSLPLLYRATNEKYEKDIKFLTNQAREILENRKSHPIEKKDLLALMLTGKDPKTGQTMSEESIIYNLITFLIAGHETTSGMLSFTTYYLLKNPEAMQKLRNEIDSVCGDREITLEDLGKMPYLLAVMRESMRLSPTAPLRAVVPLEDPCILIGGDGDPSNPSNKRYHVPPGTPLAVQSGMMMRDVHVWGEDADQFRPERMLDGGFEKLPPQAWQPFGFGMRACIGRPFAWQEAQLVLASVFQKFDLFLADPSYTLQIKQALTIKPKGLMVRAVPRRKIVPSPSVIPRPLGGEGVSSSKEATERETTVSGMKPAKTVHVLYGSNTGTCEGLAQRVVSDAGAKGFAAKLATLDSIAGRLPKDEEGPVIIITASFEGEPADNAAHFVQWLQSLPSASLSSSSPLKGTSFAVFGCGNREWASTYQRIPRLVDEILEKSGAERVFKRGEADVSAAAFFEDWEEWEGELWKTLGERYHVERDESLATEEANALQVDIVDVGTTRARLLRQPDAGIGRIVENRKLTKEGAPVKRHIEIELPAGMTYRAGDYLAILPTNPTETVERVITRFKLNKHSEVVINSNVPTTFPTNVPLPIIDLLSGYIELSQPATTRDLATLHALTADSSILSSLANLRENYQELVLSKRLSVLDILEDHPELDIQFATFLRLLPPMRVRQYSISSSPLVSPQRVSLTVSVVDAPALSNANRRYLGVASNCLSTLKPSDCIPVVVRPSGAAFHLPNDSSVPVVMFCAGSGLAPFRGFVMERSAQKASGRDVGKMLLFFGCRAPDEDYLYMDESGDGAVLKKWVEEGVVDLRPAFSRRIEASQGSKYVQDRILHDRDAVSEYFDAGAKFYTCGSRNAANGIKHACINIIKGNNPHMSDQDAEKTFEKVQKERYATDIFD